MYCTEGGTGIMKESTGTHDQCVEQCSGVHGVFVGLDLDLILCSAIEVEIEIGIQE